MAIKVINYLKDGTVVEDMSTVTVPKKNVESVIRILNQHKKKKGDKKDVTC